MVVEKRFNLRFAQAEFPLSYPAEYEKSHYDLIQPPGSILKRDSKLTGTLVIPVSCKANEKIAFFKTLKPLVTREIVEKLVWN